VAEDVRRRLLECRGEYMIDVQTVQKANGKRENRRENGAREQDRRFMRNA
jgi:hypothetical protein